MKKLSLKIRLIISFCAAALLILGSAGILSWHESRDQIDEFFDTYQLLLVKQLASADWNNVRPATQEKINQIVDNFDDDGEEDDEALGFAVFDTQGRMIFHDNENGRDFRFNPQVRGFENQKIGEDQDKWRLVWAESADGKYRIAVGQELEYRDDIAFDVLEETSGPWIAGLGFLLLLIVLLVHFELRPLRRIAGELSSRKPDDLTPLSEENIPSEIKPLTEAVNRLFGRIEQMLKRERSFVSDASHELRSPLTALKVQLEVVEMSGDDENARQRALVNLKAGIDRSTRLVEQLLALSRLDSAALRTTEDEVLDWNTLLSNAIEEQQGTKKATQKIDVFNRKNSTITRGSNFLWSLLLRNLLDNAVRYSPADSRIKIEFTADGLTVSNSGVTIDKKHLPHLGERFFRPSGQKASGSGLGLSIVEKIARRHGYSVSYQNRNNVFKVIVSKAE